MKKLICLLCFYMPFLSLIGQEQIPELISASGGHVKGKDLQISWSLGENMIETYENNSGVITQGIHQDAYETYIIPIWNLEVKTYPNPTNRFLHIKITENNQVSDYYIIRLSDAFGKTVFEKKYYETHIKIDMLNYTDQSYFVTIINKDGLIISGMQVTKIK